MKSKKEMIREIVKRFGFFPVVIEVYRIVMKAVTLIANFFLAFAGIVYLRNGCYWSGVALLVGSALIYLFALKDHSEDRIYRWSTETYRTKDHLLLTTVVLYLIIIILQILLICLSHLLKNI